MTSERTEDGRTIFETVDLGEDVGWVRIKIAGKEMLVSPFNEMEKINRILSEDQQTGAAFVQKVVEYLKDVHEVVVSPDMARMWYNAIADADRKINDFFSQRLSSSTGSDSPEEPTDQEDAPSISPVSEG